MRRLLFWCHLLTGVVAGLVILIMSITGALLGFERQIVAWMDSRALPPVNAKSGHRLRAEDLIAKVTQPQSSPPTTLTLLADASAPVQLGFGREKTLFLDPYTGAVLGEGSRRAHAFFSAVEEWHRWLGMSDSNREFARALTGASNLMFLFIVLTGPFLWLPRKWTWPAVRAGLLYRSGLDGRARDWNWHIVTGIWCAAPLLLITLTAVFMSYGWATSLLYRMTGTESPAQVRAGRAAATERTDWIGLEQLVLRAEQQSPGWKRIGVRLSPPGPGVAFTIDDGSGGQPQMRSQLVLNRRTGEVIRWEPFSANNTGRRLRIWARFTHTGEAFGLIGQATATIASTAVAVLVCTGLMLACRRLLSWRHRHSKAARVEVSV